MHPTLLLLGKNWIWFPDPFPVQWKECVRKASAIFLQLLCDVKSGIQGVHLVCEADVHSHTFNSSRVTSPAPALLHYSIPPIVPPISKMPSANSSWCGPSWLPNNHRRTIRDPPPPVPPPPSPVPASVSKPHDGPHRHAHYSNVVADYIRIVNMNLVYLKS